MDQLSTISGSLRKVYTSASQEATFNTMPSLGSKCEDSLGRRFVFVSTAVNVASGQVVSAVAAGAEIADGITAAVVGATTIYVTLAGAVAGQFDGGVISITAGANITSYAILKSTAAAAGTNKVTLTLEAPLDVAIAATDDCILVPSRYSKVIIGVAESDGVGVAIAASTAATSGLVNYMWVQCQGIGTLTVKTGSTTVQGTTVMLTSTGFVDIATAAHAVVGYSVAAGAVSNSDGFAAQLQFPW